MRVLIAALALPMRTGDGQTGRTIRRIDRWHTTRQLEQLNLLVIASDLLKLLFFTRGNSKQIWMVGGSRF
jgi:hypothetical protein